MASAKAGLAVKVDGEPMEEEAARAFWNRFSAHMEAHRGDLSGFAQAEGFASVHPETGPGGAVLIVSRSAPQKAYTNAPHRDAPRDSGRGGSSGPSKIQPRGQKPGK